MLYCIPSIHFAGCFCQAHGSYTSFEGRRQKASILHIVVTDSRRPRDSGFIERVGYFNPIARGQETRLQIDTSRVDYWLQHGVKLSPRVHSLVKEFNKAAAS